MPSIIEIFKYLVPAILTGLVTILIFRLKNSILRLQSKISVAHLITASSHPKFGKFEILHNGRKLKSMFLVEVVIINNGTKDTGSLPIKIAFRDSSDILVLEGKNDDTGLPLTFSALEELPNTFLVDCKVLNRKTSISLSILIDSQSGEFGSNDVFVAVEKTGVKLSPYKPIRDDILSKGILIIGALFSIIVGYVTYLFYQDSLIPIIIMVIAGSLSSIIALLFFVVVYGWSRTLDEDEDFDVDE